MFGTVVMRLRATSLNQADCVQADTSFQLGDSGEMLGTSLVQAGRLRIDDIDVVLRLQRKTGLRFGEAAVHLGLIDDADLQLVLSRQFNYPVLEPGDERVSSELIAAFQPSHPFVRALRGLRSKIQLHWAQQPGRGRSFAVVSAMSREGRSFLAANLAIVFAQLGQRTLLVDADLRNPVQSRYFGVSTDKGLSTLLSGRSAESTVVPTALPNLAVLPVGPTPPNPEELLGRSALAGLVRQVGDAYDVLIFDTPAASGGSDAQLVAVQSGQALVVTRKDRSRVAETKRLIGHLRSAEVELLGSVLNTG